MPSSSLQRLCPDITVAKLLRNSKLGDLASTTNQDLISDEKSRLNPEPTAKARFSLDGCSTWSIRSVLGDFRYEKNYCDDLLFSRSANEPRERRKQVIVQYRGPIWLINRMWSFQAIWASRGWDFHIRTYYVVKKDSKVLQFASQNDTQGIQELFSKGEASPFDCDEDGLTPLHVCLIAGPLECCVDNNFRSQLVNLATMYVSY